jgi:chromosome segregation ATPase
LRPSVRNIIARLGGGSPNTVLDYQKQWKAGRPTIKTGDIQLDPRINQIIAEQISKSILAASAAADADRAEAEENLETVSKNAKEAEARAASTEEALDAAIAQIQSLTGQLDQLRTAAMQAKEEAAIAISAAETRAASDVARISRDLATERAATEAARIALAKAELRLEAVPRIENDIERLRAELATERQRSSELDKLAAVAAAKQTAAEAAADRLLTQHAELRADFIQLQQAGKRALDAAIK